jgi:hypothetical protein
MHGCVQGGLSEAALSLAVRHGAGWAVCSCCWASNPQLMTLSATADALAAGELRYAAAAGQQPPPPPPPQEEEVGDGACRSPADGGDGDAARERARAAHRADRLLACGLAQATVFTGQPRAQRALNAARLAACHTLFEAQRQQPLRDTPAGRGGRQLETWLLEFPASYSVQNSVLVGEVSLQHTT